MKDAQFSSKAYGTHDYKDISRSMGVCNLTCSPRIQRDHKLSSYSTQCGVCTLPGRAEGGRAPFHHQRQLQNGNRREQEALSCLLPQGMISPTCMIFTVSLAAGQMSSRHAEGCHVLLPCTCLYALCLLPVKASWDNVCSMYP